MIQPSLGARRPKIRSLRRVSDVCPVRFVLRTKAIITIERRVVQRESRAYRIHLRLDIMRIVSQIGPRLAISRFAQFIIDLCDRFRCVEIGNVPAEVPEIVGGI